MNAKTNYDLFDDSETLEQIYNIADEIEEEEEKPENERDKKKLRDLRYAQFVSGLRLSTRKNFQLF